MAQNKINSRPPQKINGLTDDIASFVQAANNIPNSHKEEVEQKDQLPWNEPYCRDDVKKAFTVMLPEKYIMKLQFLVNHINQSQQKIARDAICSTIDQMLAKILNHS